MYMYNMNQPPKKPSPLKKLIKIGYGIAAVIAVGMMLFGAFSFGNGWLSLFSAAYAFALSALWLYRMAKSMAEEPVFRINVIMYALLCGAAVFDWVITLLMPAETLTARIVPMAMALPAGVIGAYQVWRNWRYV